MSARPLFCVGRFLYLGWNFSQRMSSPILPFFPLTAKILSMSLSIGIIGLPNVGKSTLFNALLKRQVALAANYPFATIEPNVGVVDVPDKNLQTLAQIVQNDSPTMQGIPHKITPAIITFYDIAGLVKGASQGEGLGNKFLSHIREVDALVHVVRNFSDPTVVKEGSVNPNNDIQIILTELMLADLQTLQSRIQKHESILKKESTKENKRKKEIYDQIFQSLEKGDIYDQDLLSDDDKKLIKDLGLLTQKPMLYAFNVDEDDISTDLNMDSITGNNTYINVSAKIESEICSLSQEDQRIYMKELGITESGLDKIISHSYEMLNLQTFYTAGPKEVRAWTIVKNTKAPVAAGKIHTDIQRGFIKADIVSINDVIKTQSFKKAKELGLYRLEGKEYIMQVGDIVEFKFNV